MALDRLVAEVILLVGAVYLSLSLFMVVNHFITFIDYAHYLNIMSRTYINVPDAVVVNNGTNNEVYLVVYNTGDEPVVINGVFGNCSNDPLLLNQSPSNITLMPNKYTIISGATRGNSCNLTIVFCVSNTTLCMLYPVRTTSFTLQG